MFEIRSEYGNLLHKDIFVRIFFVTFWGWRQLEMSETKCGTGTGIVREALLLLLHVADKPAFRICGSASVCFLMLQRWLQGPLGSREAALGRVARFSRMLGVWRFQNSSRVRFSWRFTRRRGRFGLDSSARSYAGFPSSRHTNSPFKTFNLHRRGV